MVQDLAGELPPPLPGLAERGSAAGADAGGVVGSEVAT